MSFTIRKATPQDVPLILQFIRDLAEFEKLLDQVTATEELIRSALFGSPPLAEALIGEMEGHPAGFALFFHNFSTFLGKPGLYVEDVYVDPAYRGRGLGRAFFLHLAALARERGCGRMEWAVLDWNERAITFYRNLGARPLEDWTLFRLDEEALKAL
ncbi:MAG TPA: GNAT family N-acetyltransferase [Acidobacteriota bacterium]|nr:GNAT family N-acetyltransferase [Acidobacteriota bacterium]